MSQSMFSPIIIFAGSQPVEWNGAFPFLPSWLRPKPSESYADARTYRVMDDRYS
jgi:hypothetical protein